MYGSSWGQPYYPYQGGYAPFRGGGGRRRGTSSVKPFKNATWRKDDPSPSTSAPVAQPGTFKNQKLVLNPDGSTSTTTTASTSQAGPSQDKQDVEIDGVTFVKNGNKLVRKDENGEEVSTPKQAVHKGEKYVRTKNGNLVAASLVKKRKDTLHAKLMAEKKARLDRLVGIVSDTQAARNAGPSRTNKRQRARPKLNKLCKYFQKTGLCTNGLRCPYIHDSNKVAICQAFLRQKCPMTASMCLLSHQPNAHRSPHCVHFPNCKNGADCPYAHVHVSRDAPLCSDFADYGWCDAGETCGKRHAFECPRFAENGVCTKKGCKLPHVLRRRNDPSNAVSDEAPQVAPPKPPKHVRQPGEETEEGEILEEESDDEQGDSDGGGEDEEPQGISERFQKKKRTSLAANDDFVGFESEGSDEQGSAAEEEEDSDQEESSDVDSIDSHQPHEEAGGQGGDDDDSDGEDDDEEVVGMLTRSS